MIIDRDGKTGYSEDIFADRVFHYFVFPHDLAKVRWKTLLMFVYTAHPEGGIMLRDGGELQTMYHSFTYIVHTIVYFSFVTLSTLNYSFIFVVIMFIYKARLVRGFRQVDLPKTMRL